MTTERQPKVIEETIDMLELLQVQIEHGGNVTITKYSSEHHHMQYLIKQLKVQLYATDTNK